MRLLIILVAMAFLYGCLPESGRKYDERYDVGYDDGYAVGYNTACKIRTTLVEGDWESAGYSDGYNAGQIDGSAACKRGN